MNPIQPKQGYIQPIFLKSLSNKIIPIYIFTHNLVQLAKLITNTIFFTVKKTSCKISTRRVL